MTDASADERSCRVRWAILALGCVGVIAACGAGDAEQRRGDAFGADDPQGRGEMQMSRAECDSILRIAHEPSPGTATDRDADFMAAVEQCERRMAQRQEGERGQRRLGERPDRPVDGAQQSAEDGEAALRWLEQVPPAQRELASVVPAGATLILVDGNTLPADFAAGRTALPFLERDGVYWGPPSDDETAIRELERLRRERNAAYIAFAWPAFWWHEHYTGFAAHLRNNYRRVFSNERLVVFDVRR
jgi:hypothetical protein